MVSTEEQVRRLNIMMNDKKIATDVLSGILNMKVVDAEVVDIPYTGYFENPIRPVDVKITFDNGEVGYVQICVNKDEEMIYQNRKYFEKMTDYVMNKD
jgi:hypothetical protein